MARSFNGTSDKGSVAVDLSAFSLITVSFWLWWNAFANDNKLVGEFGTTTIVAGGFGIGPNNSTSSAFAFGMGSASTWWYDSFPRPSAGAWHQYTLVMDRTGPTNTAYLDGLLQTLTPTNHGAGSFGAFGNQTLNIMNRSGGSLFGAGRLAELAIFGGVALTPAQAATLARGISATRVQVANLNDNWPLAGATSPEPDIAAAGKTAMTLTGTTQIAGAPWQTSLGGVLIPPRGPMVVPGHPAMRGSRGVYFPRGIRGVVQPVVAAVSCAAVVTAALGRVRVVAPHAAGAAAVTATVVRTRARPATSAGTASVSATVVRTRARTASVTAAAAVTASVKRTRALAAASAGVCTATAALVRIRARGATMTGAATATAALVRIRALAVSATGTAAVNATVGRQRALTGSASGSCTVSATVHKTIAVHASAAGIASVTVSLVRQRALRPSAAGSATVTSTVVRMRARTATVTGTATVTALFGRSRAIAANCQGFSTVTATIEKPRPVSGVSHGLATVTVGAIIVYSFGPAGSIASVGVGHIDQPYGGTLAAAGRGHIGQPGTGRIVQPRPGTIEH